MSANAKNMTIIVTKGTLDWAYPPFILGTTAMAMATGVTNMASSMMKNVIRTKGVASIPELRELAIDADIRMVACQMTIDLFEMDTKEMIDGIELGGAATYMEAAFEADINLYI